MSGNRYWLQTLGCPKNQVDSDKLAGQLVADGYRPSATAEEADLVVVNTCAFIQAAREESIATVLELAHARRPGSRLVVTGCLAERYGEELEEALPEVDLVAGFGVPLAPPVVDLPRAPVRISPRRRAATPTRTTVDSDDASDDASTGNRFDLLELPRPRGGAPWAYVKVAEGCDRICGFCAIPSFRGRQRSRRPEDILAEVELLVSAPPEGADRDYGVREVVLVAQDLASYGRDRSARAGRDRSARAGRDRSARAGVGGSNEAQPIVALTKAVASLVPRTRLLYLYPSGLTDELVEAILGTGVAYFDLSLQHASRPLLAGMRRWGDGERFLKRIEEIRRAAPEATFRSSFILGYPGETEEDHDVLLTFLARAELDWAGFFLFSPEDGTHAVGLDDQVPPELALERLRECAELQDQITARRRDSLVGTACEVLVDAPGIARTVREAPEIDGVVRVPPDLVVGTLVDVTITASLGTDLVAEPVPGPAPTAVPQRFRAGAGR
ncbi:MAG: MiaB/RimO family radical SAM methylthiotransferase [Acidimicrobiales bacterium]